MANTWTATLAALSPDHHWLFDELAGNFIDDGAVGGFDLVENSADVIWRQAPSMGPRGAPLVYGFWNEQNTQYAQFAGGPTTAGLDTGGYGQWFVGLSAEFTIRPYGNTYINNNGLHSGFDFQTNDVIRFQLLGTGGRFIAKTTSPSNGWTVGIPVFVYCEQRNDGTGLHLYINGVENTDNATTFGGTGVDIDSWVDEALSGFAVTQTTVGGLRNDLDGNRRYIVAECFMYVNNVIDDDAALLNLFNSANIGSAASDYHEGVADLGWPDQSLVIWNAHYIGNNDVGAGGGIGIDLQDSSAFSVGPSAQNVLDNVAGRRIVSDYQRFKQTYGTNNPTFFDISNENNWIGAPAVGTVNAVVSVTAVGIGDRKIIWTYGSSATNSMELGLVGSALGYQLFFRVFQATVETYRVLSGFIHLGADPRFYMLSVVQPGDGSGFRIYVNGSDETNTTPISTNPDTWVDDFTGGTRWGGEQGSASVDNFEPGELHAMHGWTKAFSPGQIEALYSYVLGQFPPFGAFANELQNTGNGALPEGPGPDWWWRMNVFFSPLVDIGIAQDRSVSPINADSIVEGGDPQFRASGPLIDDASNFSVFFDGVGDYFEIGVNSVTGELVDSSTGSIGFFFSRASLADENIVYSQGNDAYTAFWQFGMNKKRLELIVQTSVGNRVTLTGSIDHDGDYVEAVLTCNGSRYRLYDAGVEDILATVVELGTGAEGDWFDAFTADQSAVGARADNTFTTETTGRASEIFIYDSEVLSAAEVAALAAAAEVDGITGTPNAGAVLSFENVTFLNGAFADIRAESTGAIQQVVKANRCKFLGGAQGSATYKPQIAIFKGPAHVQFRGCESDLEATVGFGRGGIIGTAIDTSLAASVDGSLLVSDCDFRRIGYLNGSDFRSPVMCQAAFGMTVEHSRFRNSHGSAVGWNADAQAVSVLNNQIESTSQALGAIYSAQGLNSRRGRNWTVRANQIMDNGGNAINLNGSGITFARNISILKNEMSNTSGVAVRTNQVGDALIEDNISFGSTNGVELGAIENTIVVRRNDMRAASLDAYVTGESTLQAADVTFDRNKGDAVDSGGSGLSVDQVRRVEIINNKLVNMADGVSIGEVSVEALFAHNQILDATTPFQTIGGTARASFVVGRNEITDMGNVTPIVMTSLSANTIEVVANYHVITGTAVLNLDTINGAEIDGYLLVLRRGGVSGTNNITVREAGNLNLDTGVFIMATENDQLWLVRDGTDWNELNRVEVV